MWKVTIIANFSKFITNCAKLLCLFCFLSFWFQYMNKGRHFTMPFSVSNSLADNLKGDQLALFLEKQLVCVEAF